MSPVPEIDKLKNSLDAVFLQIEHVGKDAFESAMALDKLLKSAYQQNELSKDLAHKATLIAGKPVESIETLKKTIDEAHTKLDNLYQLDDNLKLLHKEVSKVKAIQSMLGFEAPLPQDKDDLARLVAGANSLIKKVEQTMSVTVEAFQEAHAQQVGTILLGQDLHSIKAETLSKYAKGIAEVASEMNKKNAMIKEAMNPSNKVKLDSQVIDAKKQTEQSEGNAEGLAANKRARR